MTDVTPLYRQEVFDKKRHLEGDVFVGAPLSWFIVAYVIAGFVLVLTILCFTMSYSDRRVVPGWIVPPGGLVRIGAREAGVIDAVLVDAGASVRRGQALVDIAAGRNVGAADIGQILQQQAQARLEASRAASSEQQMQIKAEISQARQTLGDLRTQRAQAAELLHGQEAMSELSNEDLERAEELSGRGFLSRQQLATAKTAYLRSRQEIATARMGLLALDQQIRTLEAQIHAKPMELARAAATGSVELAGLRAASEQTRYDSGHTLVAPIAGKVVAVNATVGDAVAPAATVMVLSPPGDALEAELFVPSSAVGLMRVGQRVALRYQSFPYEIFGTGEGRITAISQASLAPSEVNIRGLALTEPTFRVRVALARTFVNAYGKRHALQPGTLVDGDVVIAKRSLIEWLFAPLYAVRKRG